MKKALFIMALVLLFASTASAEVKFSMTGSYWAEGKYWFNYNSTPDTKANYNDTSFGFYEQDINLFPKITVDNTSLNFKIAITDTNWGDYTENGSSDEKVTQTVDTPAIDDNMQIERAYITHKFNDMYTLEVGLMDGTVWGTTFGDDKQPQWRVKGTANTSMGLIGGVLEKDADIGAVTLDAAGERGDVDSYGLFGVTKVGSVYIKPLFWYVDAMNNDTGFTVFNPVFAFTGDLGPVSFESEINYKMYESKVAAVDYDESFTTLGIYLNVFKALGNMTPGLILAYGSYDKDNAEAAAGLALVPNAAIQALAAKLNYYSGFDFEDDFDSSYILGDEYGFGGGDDLRGMSLIKLYVDDIKTPMAPLTLFAAAEYVMSNQKDNDYEDATAYELGLGANYKITDNLNYTVFANFADISYDVTGIDDPDSVYVLGNSIKFSF